jgi:hypothetical protein
MSQCRECTQLAIDVLYYIGAGRYSEALTASEKLLEVLRTYKESC